MSEHIGQPLQIERGREVQHGPRADRAGRYLNQNKQRETDPERHQKIAVEADQNAVDHPLHQKRREQQEGLERQRQREDLQQRAPQARDLAEQLSQCDCLLFGARFEVDLRVEFEHDAGEVFRDFGQRQAANAAGRVVNHGRAANHFFQNDEVIQIPVKDARHGQLRQVAHLGAQGA